MSQTVTELSVPEGKITLESPKGFPDVWLTRDDEKYPPEKYLSVDWDDFYGVNLLVPLEEYGVEIGAIIVRFYFGITGCIIPIVCLPEFDELIFIFTTAGPCDADGKKQFYFLTYDPCLEATRLLEIGRGFSSVADLYSNIKPGSKRVQPVAGGAEAVRLEYDKCGYDMPGEDTTVAVIDWSQIFPVNP
ncbi:hypothetical protein DFH09DRAFT_1282686 [Mycena vulgaris]|nr:hypothetical protein DFH09DRAFT_1282686 [Mycena vulgaris]